MDQTARPSSVIRIVLYNFARQQSLSNLGDCDALGVRLFIGVAGEAVVAILHRPSDVR